MINSNEYILQMKGIKKGFPGVAALDNVDFKIKKGEVHALMGENGAGKSTLIKVLTGIYKKDSGSIIFNGKEFEAVDAQDVQRRGISTIYQEISLIPQLSVAENIFVGREPRKLRMIDWKEMNRQSKEILSKLGLEIDVTRSLESYGTAIQQMIALARATSIQAKLVVMDEATSSLDDDEVKVLFQVVEQLKMSGVAILFISHRLNEIFEISDSITILKDGKLVGEYKTKDLTHQSLVSKMVGQDASDILKKKKTMNKKEFPEFVRMEDIKQGVKLRGINLTIGKGEVVGLAGLLGAGRTETVRVLFGADTMDEGTVYINNIAQKLKNPRNSIKEGFAFCSEDRKMEGILPHLSVRDNMLIASLSKVSRFRILSNKKQKDMVDEYIKTINIKTPNQEQAIMNLSGGNQQKVLLARWLCTNPRLIILDEPTRGIDVGAKQEIEDLIAKISAQGISLLLVSSEFDELVRNCDRIVVIRDGKDRVSLTSDEISEQKIIEAIAAAEKEVIENE